MIMRNAFLAAIVVMSLVVVAACNKNTGEDKTTVDTTLVVTTVDTTVVDSVKDTVIVDSTVDTTATDTTADTVADTTK